TRLNHHGHRRAFSPRHTPEQCAGYGFSPSPPFGAATLSDRTHGLAGSGVVGTTPKSDLLVRASVEHGQARLRASGSTGAAQLRGVVSPTSLRPSWRLSFTGRTASHPQCQRRSTHLAFRGAVPYGGNWYN